MAKITTREQFGELCLQKLGKPLIPIHVSPEQLEICIDDALKFYHDYHDDANIRSYIRKQVSSNIVTITTNTATNFVIGEEVISDISSTKFRIYNISSSNSLEAEEYFTSLAPGETIAGQSSGTTAIVATSVPQHDKENGYINIPEEVIAVTRILNFSSKASGLSMFDMKYQLYLNDMYSMMMGSTITYYFQVKQHLELLDQLLVGQKGIRFNRMMNKCFVDMDWKTSVTDGDWLILECYKMVDPDVYTDIYNDRVFQALATAILKKQWAQNLSLYGEVALPGGIKMNSDKMMFQAAQELAQYEAEFQSKYEKFSTFIMG